MGKYSKGITSPPPCEQKHGHDSNTTSYGWGWLKDDDDIENFWQGKDVVGSAGSADVGGGQPHNNMPPFVQMYFIQRVK